RRDIIPKDDEMVDGKNKNYQRRAYSRFFNPPFYAVVHPWITPTEKELQMPYLITLGLVETIFDPIVDRVKTVLDGATNYQKRERFPNEVSNEFVVVDADDGVDVDDGACVGVDAACVGATTCVGAAGSAGAGQHEGATSCRRCCGFFCEKCKKHDEYSIIILTKSLTSCVRGIGNTRTTMITEIGTWISTAHDDMIDYVRCIRPTPGGMDWIDAKRILTVMNTSSNHFMTVEILLQEGLINVYDCNLVIMEHDKFFTLIQPVFELLPKLLK
ncbi:hypothetical protein EJD97_014489, partial [Solanum chilense]